LGSDAELYSFLASHSADSRHGGVELFAIS
jgi:hypothetical protein